jgi:DnaJ family protein B protein 5
LRTLSPPGFRPFINPYQKSRSILNNLIFLADRPTSTFTTFDFNIDPNETFRQFFGSSNPFDSFFKHNDSIFDRNPFTSHLDDDIFNFHFGKGGLGHGLGGFKSHSFTSGTPNKKEKIQDPAIEHDLYVTLEEIFTGCQKKMKIAKKILQPDGTTRKEDKLVTINGD